MNRCDQLDDYLLDLLDPGERAAFAAHLAECPGCARALEIQLRLDELLTQAARLGGEPVPPLGLNVARRLSARRRAYWGAAAFVACALIAGAWFSWFSSAPHGGPALATNTAPPVPPVASRPKVLVQLGDNVIGLPIETSDPRVTIVWTYPVFKAASAPR